MRLNKSIWNNIIILSTVVIPGVIISSVLLYSDIIFLKFTAIVIWANIIIIYIGLRNKSNWGQYLFIIWSTTFIIFSILWSREQYLEGRMLGDLGGYIEGLFIAFVIIPYNIFCILALFIYYLINRTNK